MTPVSGNNSNMQIYTYGAKKLSGFANQAFGQNSEVSQMVGKLPSIINGSYDPMGDVVDALPIKNQTVKLVVGSALDILKTWLAAGNGAGKADAAKAKQNAAADAKQMGDETETTKSQVDSVMDDTTGKVDDASGQMSDKKDENDGH